MPSSPAPARRRRPGWVDREKPALPQPLDIVADRWAGLPPRVRLLALGVAVVLLLAAAGERVRHAEQRWGGAPQRVLVADEDLAAGDAPAALRAVELPPVAVPEGALTDEPGETVLSAPLPEGAVLTEGHLHPRGPAAGLPAGMRAVPVPVEDGWAVTPGGWVDVWVLGAGEQPAVQVADARPVLDVREDGARRTALVGLHADEVGPATAGLALGRLLLAHTQAP